MGIETDIKAYKSVLVLIPSAKYSGSLLKIMRALSGRKLCYVSLNRTCSAIKDFFRGRKIDIGKITFIDAITRTITTVPQKSGNCFFISSPAALTELSISLDQMLKANFDCLVMDSLSNFLIYQPKIAVQKFLLRLVNKIADTNARIIVCTPLTEEQNSIVKEVGVFFDKVIVED